MHGFVGNWAKLGGRWGIPMGRCANLAEWLWTAWRQQGPATVEALRGEWAMLVVDAGQQSIVAVRDRLEAL